MKSSRLLLILLLLSAAQLHAQSAEASVDFAIHPVIVNIANPWGLAFLPDGTLLITLKEGKLIRATLPASSQIGSVLQEISGVPAVNSSGQGGLMDVAVDPDFGEPNNRWIYLSYSAGRGGSRGAAGTRLTRAWLPENPLRPLRDVEVLFALEKETESGRHFGSRIAFDKEGYLYLSVGERGERERAQDASDAAGSVVKLARDGTTPPQIFTTGHRNIQGMARHPDTGEIWAHEHGPQGGDEINILKEGANYGWPRVTYGREYGSGERIGVEEAAGFEPPVLVWTPSIAPSGMIFYTGEAFPAWQGNLFIGALAGQHLRRVDLDGKEIVGQEVLLKNQIGRIRDVEQGPDGLIYVITDDPMGALYRLVPAQDR